MRQLALICFTLMLLGCTAGSGGYYTQSVNSWRGANLNDLTAAWGRPSAAMTANGQTVYVYKRQETLPSNTTYSPSIGFSGSNHAVPVVTSLPNVNTPANQGLITSCVTTFTANAQNIIVSTDVQGAICNNNNAKALANNKPRLAN